MKLIQNHMLRRIGFAVIWWMILIPLAGAEKPVSSNDWGPLVVHFEKNKTSLGEKEKAKIQQVLPQLPLGDQSRIFVVGYTDSSGRPAYNEKLALKRAQTVRKTIINALELDSEQVIAIGQGERYPVADNQKKTGRSRNRRVEIYLTDRMNPSDRKPKAPPKDNLAAIHDHLDKARILMLRDQWDAALEELHQAHALGGGYVGQWHALYGIIGFFKGVPLDQVRSHLETALTYEQHNVDAREFLSRVKARESVDQQRVTADMGRSVRTAIKVSSMAQQYEYLSLFDTTPRYHHQMEHPALDVWECLDIHGEPVVYYFDRSGIDAWIFDGDSDDVVTAVNHLTPSPMLESQGLEETSPASPVLPIKVFSGPISAPDMIWESKLFR